MTGISKLWLSLGLARIAMIALTQTPQLTQISECRGVAGCFTGKVTEIVDGDTIDVNNVRIRLSMVDAPEIEEAGYDEATETAESRK